MRFAIALAAITVGLAACAKNQPTSEAAPAAAPEATHRDTPAAPAHNPETERELARLRTQVTNRDAQIADLQRRLADAMNEAVRAMARLRTLATRAEAASAMAEAEVTLQPLRQRGGRDAAEADRLLKSAGTEFEQENYGGAVYLATQAKRMAATALNH